MESTLVQEMTVPMPCSVCSEVGVTYGVASVAIPYFGDTTETTISCDHCGHRDSEFMIHSEGKPSRFTLVVDRDHLDARVVRGPTGRFRIIELDLEVTPRAHADSYVSNTEGILVRFQDAVETIVHSEPDHAVQAQQIWDALQRCRDGLETLTMVLEDPGGRSLIIHADACYEEIPAAALEETHEEVLTLET